MAHAEDSKRNLLLAALPDADWQRWQRHLERVDLKRGQVLHGPGRPQAYAYFPTGAILSLSYMLENGACAEVAMVGQEGFVDTSLLLGGGTTTTHSSVLISGQGLRIGAQTFRAEVNRSDATRHLFLRYTQALATQIAQAAVCNRHNNIEQHVCGWLLHCLDRLQGAEVVVTHEVLSSLLGVRREGVTHAAGRLQDAGLIRCARGHIEVLDRASLERKACECHAVVKKEYDRLLPADLAARRAAPRLPFPGVGPGGRVTRRQDVEMVST